MEKIIIFKKIILKYNKKQALHLFYLFDSRNTISNENILTRYINLLYIFRGFKKNKFRTFLKISRGKKNIAPMESNDVDV